MSGWISGLITIVKTISQILTAGIAITAFSLLMYSLTFNLKDRVARSFAWIMFCLVVVFSTESFSSTSSSAGMIDLWIRIQWVGIILLPATYLNFSDALLETTGLPSRWRRKWAVRTSNFISIVLIILLASPWFIGPLVLDQPPAPHNQPTVLTEVFTAYYIFIMVLAWINFIRAYRRTVTKTSKRRMFYLTLSALAPAIGSFPFLLYGSEFAASQTLLFWLIAIITNTLLGGFVIIMAYSVAFFGVPWPDRVVKSRLFKWLLRGSVTASLTLAIVTIVRRGGQAFGNPYNAFVPIAMVVTVLLSEHAITMFYPYLEKWLFVNKDEEDFLLIRSLEDRIITRSDLKQFLEMVLAAVCDRLQASGAYLLEITEEGLELVVYTGEKLIGDQQLNEIETFTSNNSTEEELLVWNSDALIPLKNGLNGNTHNVLGYLGVNGFGGDFPLEPDEAEALKILTYRAAIVLRDRATQEQIFQTLERLNPQEELIQQLRAAGRYDRTGVLQVETSLKRNELTHAIKDALTHYWGGPKLTENPLLKLEIVKQALSEYEHNPANAIRSVLKASIEQIRPVGERKFTSEWLLYNILDLKFLEGKKVREIALKLALSEADLYRKQRVAIEVITDTIVQMELKTASLKEV
ncbi:MAG: hypothetical protein FD147_795 [Chloroflexi bacterium]|nr:MAG: hypothetical protein FD147_795 [Chloroflexota bacterium]MBA4375340.1 hypothetical protein [Anaerolinea sp.]